MELLKTLINSLDAINAKDIKIFNMEGVNPYIEQVVICTVSSKRQADAAVKHIKDDLFEKGYDYPNYEGKSTGWVLIDCKDVVVHVFSEEDRALYALDHMWSAIKTIDVESVLK